MPSKSKIAAALVVLGALVVWGSVWSVVDAPQLMPEHTETVVVMFAGDIMLDRNVALWREADPSPMFAGVKELFAGADYRVANLEGTITDNPSIARKNSSILRFTFDPSFATAALEPLQLDAVSLANNHALDFGEFGYEETVERLEKMGIAPFGQPHNDTGNLSNFLETPLGAICLIGYHSLFNPKTDTVLQEIKIVRPWCVRLVVFAHWGEEYQPVPEQATRAIAHTFIDAGADLVIGAHPHVVQPYEIYEGAAIFYSLGNFMFDQQFSPEVMRGLLVRAEFGPTKDCFTLIPTVLKDATVRSEPALDSFCLP